MTHVDKLDSAIPHERVRKIIETIAGNGIKMFHPGISYHFSHLIGDLPWLCAIHISIQFMNINTARLSLVRHPGELN